MIDLLSGAVGGVIVFVLTALWTESREARRRGRAGIGYARLLVTEIDGNYWALGNRALPATWEDLREAQEQLKQVEEERSMRIATWNPHTGEVVEDLDTPMEEATKEWFKDMSEAWKTTLTSEAWKEVREPLAPLITDKDFAMLDQYYKQLGWLLAQLQRKERSLSKDIDRESRDSLLALASTLLETSVDLADMLHKYTTPPWYTRVFGIRL